MLLTIGIPTYNEENYISHTVEVILKSILTTAQQIELIIVDNGSKDGTPVVLQKLLARSDIPQNLSLRLKLNPKNLGINSSLNFLMSEARGEYLWILGAHDLIQPESLKILEQELSSKPDLLIVNALIRDESIDSIVNTSLYGKMESRIYTDVTEFFQELGGPSQAISCNIFNINKVRKNLHNALISEQWGFVERLCDLIVLECNALTIIFIETPLVEMLIKVEGWQTTGVDNSGPLPKREYGPFFVMLQMAELANIKFKAFPEIRKSFNIFRDPLAIPRTIVLGKSKGLPVNIEIIKRCILAYKSSTLFWIIGLPILLTPSHFKLGLFLVKLRPVVHTMRKIFRIPIW
jgi:glycosyltransferase involved in cell wall biosynthesis